MATKKTTDLTVPPPSKAEVAITTNTTELLQQVKRCVIKSDDDAAKATSLGSLIADLLRKAEAERKELTGPLNAVIKRINDRYRENLTTPLDEAKTLIKQKLGAWMMEQRRLEEARAQKLLEQQQRAEARGATTRATNLAVQAEQAQLEAAAAGKTRGALGGSSGLRKTWTWEITDESKVPRRLMEVSDAAVKAELRQLRELNTEDTKWTTSIPGIRFYEEETVTLR